MDAAADLTRSLAGLCPGAQVRTGHGTRAAAEYAFVPDARRPRLLVPVGSARAAARSLLRFSADSSGTDVARRVAGAAWLRSGGLQNLPRLSVHGDPSAFMEAHLAAVLGGPVSFSLGLGTARVNRKPVLQVFDAAGSTIAFGKLGVSEQSRRDVAAEAAALRTLGARTWQTFEPPRVLHLGDWRGVLVLLLSPLPSRPRALPVGLPPAPLPAMQELERAFSVEPAPLDDRPWLARVRAVADGLRDRPRGELLHRSLDALVLEAGGRDVEVGAWHGDWTPWNMSGARGRLALWDWERFETGVPAGLDVFHFAVNATTRSRGTSVETVLEGLARCGAAPGDRTSLAHLRAGLYLVAVGARYLPLAEGPRGEDIAPRAHCMLDALAAWVGVPQGRGSTGDPTAASR